ncbi:hypothetical protein [Nocardia sp. N2S4-5]|uniref:hypothetical protein n=1 Tax=Nocardia sp. N2S4-5 TaxID=3351565 RepID=UPI0037D64401
MQLEFLGKGGSQVNECPRSEMPHLLTGFAEPRTFLGATLFDTGRGTFTLTGRPVAESDVLAQLDLSDGETAIEVPKRERLFYGAAAAR